MGVPGRHRLPGTAEGPRRGSRTLALYGLGVVLGLYLLEAGRLLAGAIA